MNIDLIHQDSVLICHLAHNRIIALGVWGPANRICRITLLRQFQKYLDTTPQAHRNHLRMESARNLLKNTNYPVKEIARRL